MSETPETPPARRGGVHLGQHAAIAAMIAGAIALLVVGYFVGSGIRTNNLSGLKANVASERAATFGTCHRNNLARITGNRNNYSQYKIGKAEATLLTFISTAPSGPKSPASSQAEVLFKALVQAIQGSLASEAWTPLTDCEQATDHPLTYLPPLAIPFSKQAPPLTAFTIGPNE